jgi:hypothetical protein
MKKTMTAIAAAGVLAFAAVSVPNDAQAQCRGCGIGLGIVGGLAAGAIIGSAIANSAYPAYAIQPGYVAYPAYAIQPGYVAYPAYGGPVPVGCPGGYWARRPLMDQWGNVVGYSRPRYFCP